MRKHILAFSILLFAVFLPCSATTSLEDVLNQLKANEKTLSTLKFKFHQEIEFKTSDLRSKVEGEALLKKPQKIFIQQNFPEEQKTVSNGTKIWVYTPRHKQVWAGKWGDWVHSSLPKGFVPFNNYVEDLERNFNLSIGSHTSPSDDEVQLVAVPKEDQNDYRLDLFFSKESWFLKKTIYSSSSAKISTNFSDIEVNFPVDDKQFQFVPPSGTTVIPF